MGFFPDVQPKVAEFWWWNAASVLAIAVGMTQPVRYHVRHPWSVSLAAALGLFVIHSQTAWASWWISQTTLVLVAAWIIAERGEWHWLREAVVACALFQFLAIAYQHDWPWPYARVGGTVGKRAPCSTLFAVASLWTSGWLSILLAYGTTKTTSYVGAVVAIGRWVWQFIRRFEAIGLMATVGLGAFVAVREQSNLLHALRHEVVPRLSGWSQTDWLGASQWVWGWGFQPFLAGFFDASPAGMLQQWVFYHSTWIDWIMRTGIAGAGLLAWALCWFWRRSRVVPMWRWTFLLALWAGTWQSIEQFPSMIALLAIWVIGLSQTRKEATCG